MNKNYLIGIIFLIAIISISYVNAVASWTQGTTGLVTWFNMSNSSNGAKDWTGNYTQTVSGSPTYVASGSNPFGSGGYWNVTGSGSASVASNVVQLGTTYYRTTGSRCALYWINSNQKSTYWLLSIGTSQDDNILSVIANSAGDISYRARDAGSDSQSGENFNMTQTTWHLLTICQDWTNNRTIVYLDNTLQSNVTNTFASTQTNPATKITLVGTGAKNYGYQYPVAFATVGVFNRTISLDEQQYLYNNGAPIIGYQSPPFNSMNTIALINITSPLNQTYPLMISTFNVTPLINYTTTGVFETWNVTLSDNGTAVSIVTSMNASGSYSITPSNPLTTGLHRLYINAVLSTNISQTVQSGWNYLYIAGATSNNCVINIGGDYLVPDGCYSTY